MEKKKYRFTITMTPQRGRYRGDIGNVEIDDAPIEQFSSEDLRFIAAACQIIGDDLAAHLARQEHAVEAALNNAEGKPAN